MSNPVQAAVQEALGKRQAILPAKSQKTVAKRKKDLPKELPKEGYVRIAQLIPSILPFSKAQLYRLVKKGQFPAPVKLSANISAWPAAQIRAWLDEKNTAVEAA